MSDDVDVQFQMQQDGWDRPRWLRATYDHSTGETKSYEGTVRPVKKLRTRLWAWLRGQPRPTYTEWNEYPDAVHLHHHDGGWSLTMPNGTEIMRKEDG